MNENLTGKAVVTLKKGEGRLLKSGGSWIFDNEIESVAGTFENGDILRIQDFDGFFLGYGMLNVNSKIRVRMLRRRGEKPIDTDFLRERVRAAWNYRKDVMDDTSSCRILFGEADYLPGFIADKYEDILVIESLSLGLDRHKNVLVRALKEILQEDGISIRGVYERSDAPVRRKEGLQAVKGWMEKPADARPHPECVEITENGISYVVDVENGQKTGFFLDQKNNRKAIWKLCRGKRVLDCFTHMGTFALNAGMAGAREVLGLDISSLAVSQARENARRNHLENIVHFEEADVLDKLPELVREGESYDVVILDPPAFTKSREATRRAVNGYREINIRGMKLVKDGGYLASCSCSHFMTRELFEKMIREAARAAHKRIRQVECRTQSPDHPILWEGKDEQSFYLKFYIFQVCDEK